jgi:hypothetical protein
MTDVPVILVSLDAQSPPATAIMRVRLVLRRYRLLRLVFDQVPITDDHIRNPVTRGRL